MTCYFHQFYDVIRSNTLTEVSNIIQLCFPNTIMSSIKDCFSKEKKNNYTSSGTEIKTYLSETVIWGYFCYPEDYRYQFSGDPHNLNPFYKQNVRKKRNFQVDLKAGPMIDERKPTLPTPFERPLKIKKNKDSYSNLFYYAEEIKLS